MVSGSLVVLVLAACVHHLSAEEQTYYFQKSTFKMPCHKLHVVVNINDDGNKVEVYNTWVEDGVLEKETFLLGPRIGDSTTFRLKDEHGNDIHGKTLEHEPIKLGSHNYIDTGVSKFTFKNKGKKDVACATNSEEPSEEEREIIKEHCSEEDMVDVDVHFDDIKKCSLPIPIHNVD